MDFLREVIERCSVKLFLEGGCPVFLREPVAICGFPRVIRTSPPLGYAHA